jgi:general nucleoside transport system permease protein
MTATTESSTTTAAAAPSLQLSKKAPVTLLIFAGLSILLLIVFGRDGTAEFNFTASNSGAIQLPALVMAGRPTTLVITILAVLMAAGSVVLYRLHRRTPLWYVSVFAVLVVAGFLIWSSTGIPHQLHVTGLLVQALGISTPIIFGSLGGVISERVGVTNVAIEGQLLGGAFVAAVVTTVTHSIVAGLLAAVVAGVLVSFLLGVFAIKYVVNQVIVGVVINVLILGLTTFLYQQVLLTNISALNAPQTLKPIAIPLISEIPVLGPLLFDQNIIVYLMYLAVIGVTIGLFRTRWGLRLRAVGEHPQAADTVGINVGRTRFWNVALAGAIVGLGGAYFTVGNIGGFTANVSSGYGYIALAAVIFGGWHPIRATLAALMFGFATNLGSALGTFGSPVPNDFLLMLPYIVTILAVAGFVGRVRPPAAAGRPYIKS